jgi:hypothetical protein
MVTPDAKRSAVAHLCARHEVSQRRACAALEVDRSSVRHVSRRGNDAELRARIRGIAAERRRFGYRRVHVLLKREGVEVNHKTLRRLYAEEKSQVKRRVAFAQAAAPIRLSASTRTLDIDGRAATVFAQAGPVGQGLILDPGQRFRIDLTNDLAPGETRSCDFEARPGTRWMHSHVPVPEMQLLAAPLIMRSQQDLTSDRQEVAIVLHDLSFKAPRRFWRRLAVAIARAMAPVRCPGKALPWAAWPWT